MERPHRPVVELFVCSLLIALPVLYVLSIGPVYWLAMADYIDSDWGVTYEPLYWLCRRSSAAETILSQYLALWGRENMVPLGVH